MRVWRTELQSPSWMEYSRMNHRASVNASSVFEHSNWCCSIQQILLHAMRRSTLTVCRPRRSHPTGRAVHLLGLPVGSNEGPWQRHGMRLLPSLERVKSSFGAASWRRQTQLCQNGMACPIVSSTDALLLLCDSMACFHPGQPPEDEASYHDWTSGPPEEFEQASSAATKVQACNRGRAQRKENNVAHEHATKLQAFERGRATRKQHEREKDDHARDLANLQKARMEHAEELFEQYAVSPSGNSVSLSFKTLGQVLFTMLREQGVRERPCVDTLNEKFAEADVDGDGLVSHDEFIEWYNYTVEWTLRLKVGFNAPAITGAAFTRAAFSRAAFIALPLGNLDRTHNRSCHEHCSHSHLHHIALLSIRLGAADFGVRLPRVQAQNKKYSEVKDQLRAINSSGRPPRKGDLSAHGLDVNELACMTSRQNADNPLYADSDHKVAA